MSLQQAIVMMLDQHAAEAARELFLAYHHETRNVTEQQLDAALGLSLCEPSGHDRHSEIQALHPGESVVDVSTPYEVCRGLFSALSLGAEDVVIDLGCGVGRVVLYGALTTQARFRGIELVPERAARARQAAERLSLDRVTIATGDVRDARLHDGTVYYAFRPFSVETESEVLARLHEQAKLRAITVASHRLQPSLFDLSIFERTASGALTVHRSR